MIHLTWVHVDQVNLLADLDITGCNRLQHGMISKPDLQQTERSGIVEMLLYSLFANAGTMFADMMLQFPTAGPLCFFHRVFNFSRTSHSLATCSSPYISCQFVSW